MFILYLNTDDGYFYYADRMEGDIPFYTMLNNEELLGFIDVPFKIMGHTPLTLKLLNSVFKLYTAVQFLFPGLNDFFNAIERMNTANLQLIDISNKVRKLNTQKEKKELFNTLILQKRNVIHKINNNEKKLLDVFKNISLIGSKVDPLKEENFNLYSLEDIYIDRYLTTPIKIGVTVNIITEESSSNENQRIIKNEEYISADDFINFYEAVSGILYTINFTEEDSEFIKSQIESEDISEAEVEAEIIDIEKYRNKCK